ncbi:MULTISPECIES: zinc ribbon domain-containing protein [Sphingobacterium]|uniref:zinc ribbon domain-containing protein n=1 Tax=Sphingobacterium TaxID=28453 RepID=UPI00104E7BA0|nr:MULTISPECIES: zinc ribbon domain-containing protein [Sphingobacterium]MCW2259605.1 RNA polymerase subunit RPABC4/transcription elongation factor Spt4 [Sphingobacterium kitahiroshimense]TCR13952.1 double zinc ribbon protein [Sphingobacterium sp. JUb78]
MNFIDCASCNTSLPEHSIFCSSCGNKVKCPSCKSVLSKEAKYCSQCGSNVEVNKENLIGEKSTIKYHRTKDEIFCEVSLTNEVGKDGIQSLIKNITSQQNTPYIELNDDAPHIENHPLNDDMNITSNSVDIDRDVSIQKEELEQIQQFPHIKDLEIILNCSESEWILIYAYYESDFAKKAFTRQSVRDQYLASRKTTSRVNNFENNWKNLFKLYFATLNDEQVKFKVDNLNNIENLINGKKKGKARSIAKNTTSSKENIDVDQSSPVVKKKKQKNNSNISYSLVTELNLHPKEKKSLKEYYETYKPKDNTETVLLIVYYLQKVLLQEGINENMIYTCFKDLSLSVPGIRASLKNIKVRKGWINTSNFSDLKITQSGENFFEHTIKTK